MGYSKRKGGVMDYRTQDQIEIIEAEAVYWLEQEAQERPEQFDLIVTDPPYWTLDKWRNIGTTTRLGGHRNKDQQDGDKWFDTIDKAQLYSVMMSFDNLLKRNGHLYIFCDEEVSDILKNWFYSGNLCFDYCKRLIWDKVDGGMGYHWRATYEFIMMFEKGKRRLNNLGWKDVLHHKRVQSKGHYPTEKPYSLIQELVLNSSNEGERVLDPFCGSGVVGDVCLQNKRFATLVDKSPRAMEWSIKRIFEKQPEQMDLV